MPPLSDQREILENLNLLAVRDVNDLWRGATAMDLSTDEFRQTIATATPEVLTPYASTAADLSAQWYDDAAPELPYRATPAAIAATEQIAASTSWALYATGELALGRLAGLAQRTIFNANRATIVDNARRETGATWARHASANACAFCRMLATRGAVYSSKGASVSADGGGRYHDHCHCMAVMVRPGATYEPPAYVEEWEKEYRDAVRATPKLGEHGAIDTKAVLAHMRSGETASKAAPSLKAAAGGAKPPVKPPTGGQAVSGEERPRKGAVDRSAVKHVEQHELDTADRLARLGYDVTFQSATDMPREDVLIDEGHRKLAWDFKSPTSSSRNTIMRQITKSADKGQANRWVLDVNRTTLTFDQAEELASNLAGRYDHVHEIWIIGHDLPDGLPRQLRIGGDNG